MLFISSTIITLDPMNKTQFMQQRGARYLHGWLGVSYMSCHKSNNLCPCRNHTFGDKVHHQNLGCTWSAASCFPGPNDAPHWEMCDFRMGMGSGYRTEYRLLVFGDQASRVYCTWQTTENYEKHHLWVKHKLPISKTLDWIRGLNMNSTSNRVHVPSIWE